MFRGSFIHFIVVSISAVGVMGKGIGDSELLSVIPLFFLYLLSISKKLTMISLLFLYLL